MLTLVKQLFYTYDSPLCISKDSGRKGPSGAGTPGGFVVSGVLPG
jgi:hypothetical protein